MAHGTGFLPAACPHRLHHLPSRLKRAVVTQPDLQVLWYLAERGASERSGPALKVVLGQDERPAAAFALSYGNFGVAARAGSFLDLHGEFLSWCASHIRWFPLDIPDPVVWAAGVICLDHSSARWNPVLCSLRISPPCPKRPKSGRLRRRRRGCDRLRGRGPGDQCPPRCLPAARRPQVAKPSRRPSMAPWPNTRSPMKVVL